MSVRPLVVIEDKFENSQIIRNYNDIYDNWKSFVGSLNDILSNYSKLTSSIDRSFELSVAHPDLISQQFLRDTYNFQKSTIIKSLSLGISEMNILKQCGYERDCSAEYVYLETTKLYSTPQTVRSSDL